MSDGRDRLFAAWRESWLERDVLAPRELEELEDHARETMVELMEQGLTEEAAFVIAIERLGPRHAIEAECAKENGARIWARRVVWMCVGYLVVTATGRMATAVAVVAFLLAMHAGLVGAWAIAVPFVAGIAGDLLSLTVIATVGMGGFAFRTVRELLAKVIRSRGLSAALVLGTLGASFALPLCLRALAASVDRATFVATGSMSLTIDSLGLAWSLLFPLIVATLVLRVRKRGRVRWMLLGYLSVRGLSALALGANTVCIYLATRMSFPPTSLHGLSYGMQAVFLVSILMLCAGPARDRMVRLRADVQRMIVGRGAVPVLAIACGIVPFFAHLFVVTVLRDDWMAHEAIQVIVRSRSELVAFALPALLLGVTLESSRRLMLDSGEV